MRHLLESGRPPEMNNHGLGSGECRLEQQIWERGGGCNRFCQDHEKFLTPNWKVISLPCRQPIVLRWGSCPPCLWAPWPGLRSQNRTALFLRLHNGSRITYSWVFPFHFHFTPNSFCRNIFFFFFPRPKCRKKSSRFAPRVLEGIIYVLPFSFLKLFFWPGLALFDEWSMGFFSLYI